MERRGVGDRMKCYKKNYRIVSYDEYSQLFGIGSDKDKMREAYTRAWKNRDFEIDKFWTRSAYFWGFIAAIFAGYIAVMTSEFGQEARDMNLDVYLVVLGLLFSIAWLLVIKGSKCWQQNWEAHIDKLENEITGPLYKTVYRKEKTFYSVSNVNKALAWIVLVGWIVLYVQWFFKNIVVPCLTIPDDNLAYCVKVLGFIVSLAGILASWIFLLPKTLSDGTGYKAYKPKKEGEFIDRKKPED
jgi:hypothetical protein